MPRRSARIKKQGVPVKGRWDILPHGMGVLPTPASRSLEGESSNEKATGVKRINNDYAAPDSETERPQTAANDTSTLLTSQTIESRSDKECNSKPEEAIEETFDIAPAQQPNEVAHKVPDVTNSREEVATTWRRSKRLLTQVTIGEINDTQQQEPPKKIKVTRKQVKVEDVTIVVEGSANKAKRVPRKTKDNPYGLTPGRSPFPDWQAPSAAQCEEVYRILADVHGEVVQPATIPAPSLEVAGCGEVPFVLEALLRTLLSGAVTFDGADLMVKAIIGKYGVIEDDLAKGSINWNKIRMATLEELEGTIRAGGLANRKAKAIKGILDMVHQENLDRRQAYLAERATGVPADVYGASEKTQGQKDLEVLKTERGILSLDHLHGLSADEAMRQFTKFPGIGVKTAACVILFCLQRPCFAVDTHVHRFARWLGWAPAQADENDTFSHLEVRCPDHLKYGLHQLFIHHGKQCSRCKMSTVEGTKEWKAVVCPLEHLLVRAKKMTKAQEKVKISSRKPKPQKDESGPNISEVDEALLDEEVERVAGRSDGAMALPPLHLPTIKTCRA
ncbi:DNA glycosylase [Xylaria palmicola]|nr:DNA glycosylase [Xylaria palmicola]